MIKDTKLNKFVNPIINGKKNKIFEEEEEKTKISSSYGNENKNFLIDKHMCNRHLNINYSGIFCCLGMFIMFNSS